MKGLKGKTFLSSDQHFSESGMGLFVFLLGLLLLCGAVTWTIKLEKGSEEPAGAILAEDPEETGISLHILLYDEENAAPYVINGHADRFGDGGRGLYQYEMDGKE